MAMDVINDQLVIGGRAGLTYMDSTAFEYDEAIRDIAFDYSFITDIDVLGNHLLIAGRGGVFRASLTQRGWDRLITKKDLTSKRIYSIAAGSGGNLMVATERNAYLFHESGMILRTLFPIGLDWPVFDIKYEDGQYYLSTYYGLYVYDEVTLGFTLKVNSSGSTIPISENSAIDPIYESILVGDKIWASTHRGLMTLDFLTGEGAFHLSPSAPFKPRGLTATGKSVWIGTDIGLYSFNSKSSSWRHYTVSDGLISNFVTELITRDAHIWVGTNLGLTRIKWKNLY
jgi:ligand-binding sensor domain-containing protein